MTEDILKIIDHCLVAFEGKTEAVINATASVAISYIEQHGRTDGTSTHAIGFALPEEEEYDDDE